MASKKKSMAKKAKPVPLEDITGKTIYRIKRYFQDTDYGREMVITLFFTDNTKHGFIIPADCED